ncbi:thermonuclease family protein [Hoeflea sp.]|uniref:thermonuclease family protein n=1 Tax=Hoeflea sp. TaxID=1940281 RepID=UPI0037486B8B
MTWRAALGVTLIALASPTAAESIEGHIDHVTDGDTFAFPGLNIRICGIEAPERGAPGFDAATQALEAIIGTKTVKCLPVGAGTICDGRSKTINRKRVVAQCFVDDVDIGAEMVRRGHACDWRKFSGGAYPGGCVK